MTIFVERLTLGNFFAQILPVMIGKKGSRVFVFDARKIALKIAAMAGGFFGIPVEKLKFRLVDIRDEENLLVRERIPARDLWEIWDEVLAKPFFQKQIDAQKKGDRRATYLMKDVTSVDRLVRGTLFRAVLLVQIVQWHCKQKSISGKPVFLYLIRRPWKEAIQNYGRRFGVGIHFQLPMVFLNLRSKKMKRAYQWLLYCGWFVRHFKATRAAQGPKQRALPSPSGPRLIVDYSSRLNLDQPELFSDLFFWQQSELRGENVSAVFSMPKDPVNAKKWEELQRHQIKPIVLHPAATVLPQSPPYWPRQTVVRLLQNADLKSLKGMERRWVQRSLKNYDETRVYWRDVFEKHHGKIYVSWYRYSSAHCAIAAAMREAGGVFALYQWAMDTSPLIDTLVDSDVVFGYSREVATLEKKTGSRIPYFVITGFLGDHRIPLLKAQAQTVRQKLMRNGVKKIIAFLDENSGDDSRWHTGHEFMRVNYEFLLQKVLENPSLGLVMKPKTPMSLRRRLGPIAELLREAEATGRVHMYEAGPVLSYYPPAAAALCADVAIHGCLTAATAGLECALTGVPTLLVDRESWPVSPLYNLGEGKVIFREWDSLWNALEAYFENPALLPGFGDWSSMIDQLDPFRDGRAAERMGTYLQWMMEGFKAGRSRDIVMADAAERYCKQWGSDKIVSIQ